MHVVVKLVNKYFPFMYHLISAYCLNNFFCLSYLVLIHKCCPKPGHWHAKHMTKYPLLLHTSLWSGYWIRHPNVNVLSFRHRFILDIRVTRNILICLFYFVLFLINLFCIFRFEKLDITPKSAQKIKPVLERWMKEAEERLVQWKFCLKLY